MLPFAKGDEPVRVTDRRCGCVRPDGTRVPTEITAALVRVILHSPVPSRSDGDGLACAPTHPMLIDANTARFANGPITRIRCNPSNANGKHEQRIPPSAEQSQPIDPRT